MKHVKIPKDRIGALIGDGGETLRRIEAAAEVDIDVDSQNGAVAIERTGDPVRGMKAPEIVQAIGRGFKPEEALTLLDDDMRMFDTIDIERAARNDNDLRRKKGRLIGENGRTRELMEELTGASVVIYGSTFGRRDATGRRAPRLRLLVPRAKAHRGAETAGHGLPRVPGLMAPLLDSPAFAFYQ
jgi:ribosomal RNA assembly protein